MEKTKEELTDIPSEDKSESKVVPILPLRGTVVFPFVVVPLMIQESEYVRLVDEALMRGSRIGLFLQRDPKQENPGPDDLYEMGAAGNILKMLRFPDGTVRFLIQGLSRVRVKRFTTTRPYLQGEIEELEEIEGDSVKTEAQQRNLMEAIKQLVELAPYLTEEFHVSVINQDTISKQADFLASNLNVTLEQKQEALAERDVLKRLHLIYQWVTKELEVLELSQKIQAEAASELGKSQRDYILREQLKAIKKELGDGDGREEIDEFETKIKEAQLPEYAGKAAFKELSRLQQMSPSSAEYTVSRTYLDWLVCLPWSVSTRDVLDLRKAKRILDNDHWDLEKVKDRILEHLAVRKLKSDLKGPILCFAGPPGVGKTSLGRSIASAMGRKFYRLALGGMRDEAEIRGHRRTYIGSMPGRIIQALKRCESNNPVIMLDEVDKLGTDFRGDPASALLEVLDPEQNNTFSDHYLDLPFDLSKVLFITTANWLEPIPAVLRDRMEIIRIPGYTDQEKLEIAKRHLVPKQLENHGLGKDNLRIKDDAIRLLIDGYTREAGLRNLEREIASVNRKVARKVAGGSKKKVLVEAKNIPRMLGPIKFAREVLTRQGKIGVVPGLAYTSVGGEVLFVEATSMTGKGNMLLTGQLGDVMKESARAALSFVRSNAEMLGIDDTGFGETDIHVHVPAGATPKDGPSAGITMAVALTSLFTRQPVKPCLAMTGEVTLRGELLPIGGLKEKLLAAVRLGVNTVLLPEGNRKDAVEVPREVRKQLKFKYFSDVLSAVSFALDKKEAAAGKKTAKGRTKPRRKTKKS
jgi:ATP-dependent Lon protease